MTWLSLRARCAVALVVALSAAPAAAQVVILHSFAGGTTDGQTPVGAPLLTGSTLYGMTSNGGATFSRGTIYRIGPDGSGFSLLHSFAGFPSDGQNPNGALAQAGPTLYGLTSGGGTTNQGAAFGINADGTGYGLLHQFAGGPADGRGPLGTPVFSGGVLYGMTPSGGASNLGTVFRGNADGTGFGLLHSFAGGTADGQTPGFSAPALAGSTLYGMTNTGGAGGVGTVFRVNTDGTGYGLMHSFDASADDAWAPAGSLTLVGSTLYGLTRQGGGGAGTVFKINTDGTGYGILHTFLGGPADGANPGGDLLAVGSALYGTTATGGANALGTLFKIEADGTEYQLLHSFTGGPGEPANPGNLTTDGSVLYGISAAGGASNLGTLYSFPIAVPEPSPFLLVGAAGMATLLARRQEAAAGTTVK